LKVLIAGGGTAGHINPALAIADTIKKQKPDADILFVGTPKGMESRLVPSRGYKISPIDVRGFQRKISVKNVGRNASAVIKAFTSSLQAKKIVKDFVPDIAVGTGGYVSGPIIRACQKAGVKTVIHEQNSFPGVTTKLLSKNADAVMLASEDAKEHLDKGLNIFVTGNPVREEFFSLDKKTVREKLGISQDKFVVLSFGGSLGARSINTAAAEIIASNKNNKDIVFIHSYGQYGKWFPDLLTQKGVDISSENLDVREYIDNISQCMAAADILICRAGAITLSEITVLGKASILIPSPNVAENHQYYNALALAKRDAAVIVEERELAGNKLIKVFSELYQEKDKLQILSENSKKLALPDTNSRIYGIINDLLT